MRSQRKVIAEAGRAYSTLIRAALGDFAHDEHERRANRWARYDREIAEFPGLAWRWIATGGAIVAVCSIIVIVLGWVCPSPDLAFVLGLPVGVGLPAVAWTWWDDKPELPIEPPYERPDDAGRE